MALPRIIMALPAYNEEDCLPPLLEAYAKTFARLPKDRWRVIVVDDGSKDRTAEVTREAAERMPVQLVMHEKNKGLGEAIKTGLRAALEHADDDDLIVCMDADNTHPPSCIPKMYRKMLETGADVVIASRYRQGSKQVGVPFHRQMMSNGALLLFMIFLGIPGVRDYTCGFRAYRAGLIRRAFARWGDRLITRQGFACTDELLVNLAQLDPVFAEVPFILRYDRKVGPSKIQLGKTIGETFRLLKHGRDQLRSHKRRKARGR